jgi:hypothetical protein
MNPHTLISEAEKKADTRIRERMMTGDVPPMIFPNIAQRVVAMPTKFNHSV